MTRLREWKQLLRAPRRSALAVLAALLASASPAQAAKINIGAEAVVRHLQDVRLQNDTGEALYLGYKITFHWLGLPYAVSRDGYVLGVKGKQVHYPVETAKLQEWGAQGYVPSPLPEFSLGTVDYALGYLLWIVLALTAAWYGGKALRQRAARKSAKASRPAPTVSPERQAQALAAGAKPAPPTKAAEARPRAAAPAEPAQLPARSPAPQQAGPAPTQQRAAPPAQRPPAEAVRLPVAKTVVRVKALKVA